MKIMSARLEMPFDYDSFYAACRNRCLEHAKLINDNNVLKTFWNTIEILVSDQLLLEGHHFRIATQSILHVKDEGAVKQQILAAPKEIIFVQLKLLHDKFAKRFREINNKVAPDPDTIITYLKDQPYYMGLCPVVAFKSTKTSAYMVDYSMLEDMGINLKRYSTPDAENEENENKPVGAAAEVKTANFYEKDSVEDDF
jgi:hypothetical protein